jgi:hypothetical protein
MADLFGSKVVLGLILLHQLLKPIKEMGQGVEASQDELFKAIISILACKALDLVLSLLKYQLNLG